jgi:hypothetical protein
MLGMIETRTSMLRDRYVTLQPAILRHTSLGDIQLCKHLDSADRMRRDVGRIHAADSCQDAVNPELDGQARGVALEMDVRRARLERVVEGRVHEPDRGAGVPLDRRKIDRLARSSRNRRACGVQGSGRAEGADGGFDISQPIREDSWVGSDHSDVAVARACPSQLIQVVALRHHER